MGPTFYLLFQLAVLVQQGSCWTRSGGVGVRTRVGRWSGTYVPPPASACCVGPAVLMLDTEWWDRGGDQGRPVEWDLRSASCFSLLCWSSRLMLLFGPSLSCPSSSPLSAAPDVPPSVSLFLSSRTMARARPNLSNFVACQQSSAYVPVGTSRIHLKVVASLARLKKLSIMIEYNHSAQPLMS